MTPRKRLGLAGAALVALGAAAVAVLASQLPAIGAGAVLFPTRNTALVSPPEFCVERRFEGVDAQLAGWQCASGAVTRKGTIVYLHGIADNRSGASGIVTQLLTLGYDVIAYDSRAHGASGGDRCTYGYYEKEDLRRVIAQLGAPKVALMGQSLGGAVALQAAAIEPAVRAVIAISTFADLRSVVTERAPKVFFPSWAIAPALDRAAAEGRFLIDERLVLVPGAGHNDVMRHHVWKEIEDWLGVTLVK